MNLLSSQNKILLKLIFLQTSLVYSEFPVSKNINNVTFLPGTSILTETQVTASKTLQQRHSQLKQQIDIDSKCEDKNYFACCFVFKLSTGQEIEVPLLNEFITQTPTSKFAIADKDNVLMTIKELKTDKQSTRNITFVSHSPKEKVNIAMATIHELFFIARNKIMQQQKIKRCY